MNDPVPSREALLMALQEQQQRIMALLTVPDTSLNQGKPDLALEASEQLIGWLRSSLELQEFYNQRFPETPFDVIPTVQTLLNTLTTQADIFQTVRSFERAEERRKEAEQLAAAYLAEADRAERERQRAAALIGQGRFNEALVALNLARDAFEERQDALNLASVTANLAGIYEWLGDYPRALDVVGRARALVEPLAPAAGPSLFDPLAALLQDDLREAERAVKLHAIRLELAQTEARTHRYLGNYDQAERLLAAILDQVPSELRPGIEMHLAAIAIGQGRYGDGLAILERLEPVFRAPGMFRPKLGVFLSWRGEARLGSGNPAAALADLETSVQELQAYRDPDSLWKSQWRRARALVALGRPVEALSTYAQAVDSIGQLRKAPLGYRLDSTYLKDKLPVFEQAIRLACDGGAGELCCLFIEAIKSRTLSAVLGIPAGSEPQGTGELDRRLDELSRQLDALEYAAYSAGSSAELEQGLAALRAQRADLLEQIRFSDPRWRFLSEPVPFNLQEVIRLLASHQQAALHLFYQPQQVTAVLIWQGKCAAARQPLSDETRLALSRYQENLRLTQPNPEWFDPSSGLGLDAGQLLPAELLAPALEAKSLIVVPHGPLHLLPWAGLTYQGLRLFERCPVEVLPNLSCTPSLAGAFSTTPQIALIGAPDYRVLRLPALVQAEVELQDIEQIYLMYNGLFERVFMGKEATEANFWRLAKHPASPQNILHISSHGEFEPDEPMSSGLLLSDGRVDAAEIARVGLRYDEVILSACSTGYRPSQVQGIELSGDDILGLPGALLEAGVRSVLVSIPPAREDAAQRFMSLYHEERAAGVPPAGAYQQAQKAMLADSGYAPYLWIGFTLYGAGGAEIA